MWSGAFTEMSKSPLKAVCDAGPIIHLDEIGVLPPLHFPLPS